MTPRAFYELFVGPNLEDYLNCPADARLGFNAALAAFQLADVFYNYYKRADPTVIAAWPKLKHLHVHLTGIEPAYATIQGVATVYKHLYARGGHYLVGSPGAVWGVKIPSGQIELETDWPYDAKLGDVLVNRKDGSSVSLTHALEKVVDEMWPAFLPAEPT